MNKQRRKEIAEVVQELETLKERIEVLRDEEQEYFDNMPEGIQMSERGDLAQEAASNLEYAADGFDELIGNLNAASE